MIVLNEKQDCCGCTACVERCPKQCITMQEDEEGFLYPHIEESICIDCGLCEKVCPVINQAGPRKPLKVYAAKNPDEKIRMQSSSGGVFTMLAEKIINDGGAVFGAKFNKNWEVVHDYTETIDGLAAFRGSKYVQSNIGNCYIKAEQFLKDGRKILFSGTPCQIAGLNLFLKKEYNHLLTIDVVCHGVPSPIVWRDYIKSISKSNPVLSVTFRDKSTGWKNYSTKYVMINTEVKHYSIDDNHMQGFLLNLYLRPACYACPSKCGKSMSDITIGDFWGIQNHYPDFDDDKGTGLVLLNTEKSIQLYKTLHIDNTETTYQQAYAGNPAMEHSAKGTKQRVEFWKEYKYRGIGAIKKNCNKMKPSMVYRVINKIKRIIKE